MVAGTVAPNIGKRESRSKRKMKIGEELDGYLSCSPCLQALLHHAMCSKKKCSKACVHSWRTKRESLFFFCDINERNYRAQRTEKKRGVTCRPISYKKFSTWRAQPCDNDLKERFLSFLFLLFCFYLPSAFLVLSFLLIAFCYAHSFYPNFSVLILSSAGMRYAFYRHPLTGWNYFVW